MSDTIHQESAMTTAVEAPAHEVNGTAPKAKRKPKVQKVPEKGAAKAKATGDKPLRKTQIRILQFLSKKVSATKAECTVAGTGRENGTLDGSHIGCRDPKARKIADAKSGRPSLLTRGYIKEIDVKVDGDKVEHRLQITAAGKKALEKLKAK